MRVGLDIGSTTIKCVVLDEHDALLYSTYERHYSHILEKAQELLRRIDAEHLHGRKALLSISGSAGMGLADSCGVPFVQEVFSTRVAVKRFVPATDCVIELGGEDAKILFLTNGTEVRMNGSCAGGTGAFIDQMATLLKMGADEMNKAAENAQRTYTIASRCGVFAKSDVQPLINQGARTEDIAASIYKAVVNQTIAGLAQGRPIKGNILYLGGPLTFSSVLRKSFDEALNVTGTCPENSLLYVALGAALYADKAFVLSEVADALDQYAATATYASEPPLFASKEEYEAFHARHMSHSVPRVPFSAQCGPVHIGIDSGSTTVKLVVVDEKSQILYTNYQPNLGNPLPLIREQLLKIYKEHPGLQVASVTTTGYGEELVKNAFRCDYGLVETVAHFTAAKYFMPDVDFIIDIGGQDMKCFKIEDGAISNIFLNEACSSGCGSFLQTFAQALGYDIKEFAALGLFADRPVDLGSRCTVFMNSSIVTEQRNGKRRVGKVPFCALPQLYRRPERRMPSRDIIDDIDSSQSIHVSGDRILRNAGTDIFVDGLRSGKRRLISRKRCQKGPDLDRITLNAVSSRNIRFAYAINISSGNPHSIFSCFPYRLRPTATTQQIGDTGDAGNRSDCLLSRMT